MNTDTIDWHAHLAISRWDEDAVKWATERLGHEPTADELRELQVKSFEDSEIDPANLLTTAGIGRIATLLNAGTGNLIASTTARVGVGDGAGTAAIGDTDLSAAATSAHRWFNLSTVSIPSNVLTFASSFASGDGNFAWNEWGIDIGTATVSASATVNAVLLNHKTSIAQGTKASGQVWSATATITLS